MAVVKVETDIVISITPSPKGVIMYAEAFTPDIVVFIGFKDVYLIQHLNLIFFLGIIWYSII